jgi:hypothetical protein
MSRYYFHFRDDDDLLEDRIGTECSDLDAAEREAAAYARELLIEAVERGGSPMAPRCIEIVDERGCEVLYLPFWGSFTLLPDPDASWEGDSEAETRLH